MRRQGHLCHLHAQPQINAGGHRIHQAPVASLRDIAEVVAAVFGLVPHPAQRLPPSEASGLGLDHRVQRLARPPRRPLGQASSRDERFDPICCRRIRPELRTRPAGRLREGLILQAEACLHLRGRQPAPLTAVKNGQLRQRVCAAAGNAGLTGEGAHWVPGRHVYPRPAQIDRQTGQVDRVQPAADPIASLQHHTLSPSVGERVGDGQSCDPRANHHHALDRPVHPAGNVCAPVTEAFSSHRSPAAANGHATTANAEAAARSRTPRCQARGGQGRRSCSAAVRPSPRCRPRPAR